MPAPGDNEVDVLTLIDNLRDLSADEMLRLAAEYTEPDGPHGSDGFGAGSSGSRGKAAGNVDQVDRNLNTQLMRASAAGDGEAVHELLGLGADHALRNEDGDAALHLAVVAGRTGCLRLLLAAGADPDRPRTDDLITGIIMAATGKTPGCGAALELLLAAGADLEAKDARGCTALHYAVLGGQTEPLERLLAAGDPSLRHIKVLLPPPSGDRAAACAGGDTEARLEDGRTALHLACTVGNVQAAGRLLSAGCDFNAVDEAGRNGRQIIAVAVASGTAALGHLALDELLQEAARGTSPAKLARLIGSGQGGAGQSSPRSPRGEPLHVRTLLNVLQEVRPAAANLMADGGGGVSGGSLKKGATASGASAMRSHRPFSSSTKGAPLDRVPLPTPMLERMHQARRRADAAELAGGGRPRRRTWVAPPSEPSEPVSAAAAHRQDRGADRLTRGLAAARRPEPPSSSSDDEQRDEEQVRRAAEAAVTSVATGRATVAAPPLSSPRAEARARRPVTAGGWRSVAEADEAKAREAIAAALQVTIDCWTASSCRWHGDNWPDTRVRCSCSARTATRRVH